MAVVIQDKKERILLTQRGRISRDEFGKWENCGGAVEEGETEEEAIKREVKEELGTGLKIAGVLYKDKFTTDSGAKWEVTVFSGEVLGTPKVQNSEENSQVKWFAKNDLKGVDLASYTKKDFKRFGWL